ncbi:MAG: hypothetical protein BWK79_05295 [Beggiatoa sp. IS2]|nr:MAG: hypothetical protein BWK79_05295 [Beggiatoa sp. IS2]
MTLKTSQGFTLIELIIVVTIIGLLSMIAVPTYNNHITKSRRADAKASLMELSQLQESFYGDNSKYAKDLEELGATKFGFKGSGNKFTSKEGFYELSVEPPKDEAELQKTYTLKAVPIPSDNQESREKSLKSEGCLSFTIDAAGNKKSSPKIDCWH